MKTKLKQKRKLVIAILSAVFVAAIALGGTMAYFTDNDRVVNTFTMGKVNIKLEEPGWNDATSGRNLTPGNVRVKDPTVTAIEGQSYMRVRMEIVDGGGALVTDTARIDLILASLFYDKAYGTSAPNIAVNQKYDTADLQALITAGKIHAEYNLDAFAFAGIETGKPAVRYYNYKNIFDATKPDITLLFSNVVMPINWHNEEIFILGGDSYAVSEFGSIEVITAGTGYKILLMAEAIQSSEMASAAEAFAELDKAAGITRDMR